MKRQHRLNPAPGWGNHWRLWFVVRPGSLWIGVHWSPGNRRLCINLVPCLTIALVFPGGIDPDY